MQKNINHDVIHSYVDSYDIVHSEMYFEILGFEQSSIMQILSNHATECSVTLVIPELSKWYNIILLKEYGVVAQGTLKALDKFAVFLTNFFDKKFVKGDLATSVIQRLREKSLSICTVESCTGGIVSSMLTAINGASDVYKGGITAYSIESKRTILGIKDSLLQKYSVYSEECVKAMAKKAINLFGANVAIATSGLATQDTSSNNFLHLPAGLVFICILQRGKMPITVSHNFLSNRNDANIENRDDNATKMYNIPISQNMRNLVQHNASMQCLRLILDTIN